MAVAAKMRCRTPKHGISFGLKTENCVEATKPILRSCIVNLLQQTNNGVLFSFVRSVVRECGNVGTVSLNWTPRYYRK